MKTDCVLVGREQLADGSTVICFEPAIDLPFTEGQFAKIVDGQFLTPTVIRLIDRDKAQGLVRAGLPNAALATAMEQEDALYGAVFSLQGPFPDDADEISSPEPNPLLWQSLHNGLLVRKVLETYYQYVYGDPLLCPLYEHIPIDRIIGEQYAFLKQCMTGDNVFIGLRPKATHQGTALPDALLERSLCLLRQAQRAHGLTPEQMAGWDPFEEHGRIHNVRHAPWPKRAGASANSTRPHGLRGL